MLARLRKSVSLSADPAPSPTAATTATASPISASSAPAPRVAASSAKPTASSRAALRKALGPFPTPAPAPAAAAAAASADAAESNSSSSGDGDSATAIADDLREFACDATLDRYLVARDHDVARAAKQLRATLEWRAAFPTAPLRAWRSAGAREQARAGSAVAASLRAEAASGKMFVLPRVDDRGRSTIMMRPGLENSSDARGKMRYLVYTLERASWLADAHRRARRMGATAGDAEKKEEGGEGEREGEGAGEGEGEGEGMYVVINDYTLGSQSLSNLPSVAVMRETTAILQGHYPERLACMVFVGAPRVFHGLFRMIKPLIDAKTRTKLQFVDRQDQVAGLGMLDRNALPKVYGGENAWEFDPERYFNEDVITPE